MIAHAAQHALPLTRVAALHAPRRRSLQRAPGGPRATSGLARGIALVAVWAAAWLFLLAGVAAPAGRLHAEASRLDRAGGPGNAASAWARSGR